MDKDVMMFGQVMAIIVASVASMVVIALGARILWRLGSRTPRELPAADSGQLERLESSVELMAIEMERISEAQRFTLSVLNDRLPQVTQDRAQRGLPQGAAARHQTPH